MNTKIALKSYVSVWICSFFKDSLMKLLAISIVCKCIILVDKHVNLKLGWMENYDIKPKKKKKKSFIHALAHVMRLAIFNKAN